MGPKYNIQIMKLSSYYKQRRELVSLITNLSRAKYYTKVYYRHNDVNLKFPAEIYELPDVELGGYAINPKY